MRAEGTAQSECRSFGPRITRSRVGALARWAIHCRALGPG